MLMSAIKKWLHERLNITLDGVADHFIEMCKDGTLLAQILQNYGIIQTEDLQLLEETTDPVKALENFVPHIRNWLSRIDLCLTDNDIWEIVHGDGTAALTIFYDVYIRLENPQKEPARVVAKTHKFDVEKVDESAVDVSFGANPLCEPLLKQWDVISWERDHLMSIMIKYKNSRSEYEEYLENKNISGQDSHRDILEVDNSKTLPCEGPNYCYRELIDLQKKALEMKNFEPNVKEAKRILNNIKKKNKQRAERNAFQRKLQQETVTEVLKKVEEDEEIEFDKIVCEKLLKQSQYEKEIAEKLFGIRKQKEIVIENRKKQDKLEQKQKEEEFIRRIFEEELEERLKHHCEKMALVEEHKKLYAEKMRVKALKHQKLVEDAVKDIIDVAIKTVEYKEMYGIEPSKYLKRNWATLFVKQQPIFDVVPSQIPTCEEELAEDIDVGKVEGLDSLDEADFNEYINFKNFWIIEDGFEEYIPLMELGMNVLGYIVHRLLLRKYPLPIPEKPKLSPEIKISACTHNMIDMSMLSYLQCLLELRNVKVIQMEDATNFCIQAYEIEKKTEFDEPFPDDDQNLKQLTPTKGRTQKDEKKGKKEKKSKAPKTDKGSKKGKDTKKLKKGKQQKAEPVEASEPVQAMSEEKQAQTPKLFPWERVVLSNKARLGKTAKAIKEMGHQVDDQLLVNMFVEYLSSLVDIKGWVLINYPNTYEQAKLLEQALTGKPVPKEYGNLNKISLESMQIEESEIFGKTEFEKEQIKGDTCYSTEGSCNMEEEIQEKASDKEERNLPTEIKCSFDESERQLSTEMKCSHDESEIELVDLTAKSNKCISKERIAKLLPDLKHLAYSSDEDEILQNPVDNSFTQSEVLSLRNCICVCNKRRREKTTEEPFAISDSSERTKEIVTDETQKKVSIGESLEQATTNLIEDLCTSLAVPNDSERNVESHEIEQTLTEYEKAMAKLNTDKASECVCYMSASIPEGQEVDKTTINNNKQKEEREKNVNVRREEEDGSVDDKPHERPVAEDVNENKRLSKIVRNPRPLEKQVYNTILTAYIKIMPKEEEPESQYKLPIFKEFEKKDPLVKFYGDQGCFYLLEYQEFNSETVKCLAKMIIGDYSLPLKSSIEMFGERYKEAIFEIGDVKITKKGKEGKKEKKKKKNKDKINKTTSKTTEDKDKMAKGNKKAKSTNDTKSKSSKDKKSKSPAKGKKGKKQKDKQEVREVVPIEYEDKEVQFPMVEEVEEEEECREPRAGELDWEYVELPVPLDIELTMANFWENMEDNYIKNLKYVFSNRRVMLNDIVPFLAKVKKTMEEFIARPDSRQFYLREFQKTLNEVDLHYRNDPATKSELYRLIEEFKEKILGVSDKKMRESEERRRELIRENWLFRQFCQMTNNVIAAFQLEIDRFIDTLQLISDYYTSMVTKSLNEGYDFHKETLTKHECEEESSKQFNSLFIDAETVEFKSDFHDFVRSTCEVALGFVGNMRPLAFKPVNEMKKLFEPQVKEKKKPGKKKKGAQGDAERCEPDADIKENADRIFEEWECALCGEMARMVVTLNVLKNEACSRFDEAMRWIGKVFKEIYDSITVRYENELSSIHKACELLMQSVEQEIIIQPELTFEGDQLAKLQITLCPDSVNVPSEDSKDGSFNLPQVNFMVNVLLDLAANGFIIRKTFLLLLQDMLYEDVEEKATETPKLWRNLSIKTLDQLLKKIFCDEEDYLYWKDFIVCSLLIPFPSREELMEMRNQFRKCDPDLTEIVHVSDFNNITFWFDEYENMNTNLLKSILFRMYQTDEESFNYTAMLLDFCKDEDPVIGFVKALELSLGKRICYDIKVGSDYVKRTLEERTLFEQKKKEHEISLIIAEKFINRLVDRVVNDEDQLEITDITKSDEKFKKSEESVAQPDESDEIRSEKIKIQNSNEDRKTSDESVTRKKSNECEEISSGKIMIDGKFSYKQIGYESRDDMNIAFFLPLQLVLNVVNIAIGWSFKTEGEGDVSFTDKIINIYKECKNENFNNVLSHEFLNHEELKKLFKDVCKFSARNPVKLIKQILYDTQENMGEEENSFINIDLVPSQLFELNETPNTL